MSSNASFSPLVDNLGLQSLALLTEDRKDTIEHFLMETGYNLTGFGPNVTDRVAEIDLAAYMKRCDRSPSYHRDYTQITGVRVTMVVLYCAVMFGAIVGNIMVVLTITRNAYMRTVTNYYIFNLAVSDLLVSVIVMPLKLLEYTSPCHWQVFGNDILCSLQYYLLPIFVFASDLTLVAISIERYYAIVHPLNAMKVHSKSRTCKIIATTWIIPIVITLPYLYCRSFPAVIGSELGTVARVICNDKFDEIDVALYGETSRGTGQFRRAYFLFLFFTMFILPSVAISTTCIRISVSLSKPVVIKRQVSRRREMASRHEENKRRVSLMVIMIAVTFILAWSPFYLTTAVSQLQEDSFLREGNFFFTMLLTHWFGFLNSCLNPFVYSAMSDKFRRNFKQIIFSCFACFYSKRMRRYQNFISGRLSNMFGSLRRRSSEMETVATEFRLSRDRVMPEETELCVRHSLITRRLRQDTNSKDILKDEQPSFKEQEINLLEPSQLSILN